MPEQYDIKYKQSWLNIFSKTTPLVQKKMFIKLPLEQRRKILAKQADRIKHFYNTDKAWKILGAGAFSDNTLP